MKVKVIKEEGHDISLNGISLSFNTDRDMEPVATKLAKRDLYGGENKFLEGIVVWLDITAPRYWWQQFDTYRVGMSKQSESTMHTVLKQPITQDMFEDPIHPYVLELLEGFRKTKQFSAIKAHLPEAFLQRRIVCTNYKAIKHIIRQRLHHRLPQWQTFCTELETQLEHKEYLDGQGESEKDN